MAQPVENPRQRGVALQEFRQLRQGKLPPFYDLAGLLEQLEAVLGPALEDGEVLSSTQSTQLDEVIPQTVQFSLFALDFCRVVLEGKSGSLSPRIDTPRLGTQTHSPSVMSSEIHFQCNGCCRL